MDTPPHQAPLPAPHAQPPRRNMPSPFPPLVPIPPQQHERETDTSPDFADGDQAANESATPTRQVPAHPVLGRVLHPTPMHRAAARPALSRQALPPPNAARDDRRADSLQAATGYPRASVPRRASPAASSHQLYPHRRPRRNTDCPGTAGRFPVSNDRPGARRVLASTAVRPSASTSHHAAARRRYRSGGQRVRYTLSPDQEEAVPFLPPPSNSTCSHSSLSWSMTISPLPVLRRAMGAYGSPASSPLPLSCKK